LAPDDNPDEVTDGPDDPAPAAEPVAAARARRERTPSEREVAGSGRGGAIRFLRECVVELRRVQWPDRVQLWQATLVVLVAVALVGFYLYGLDTVFRPLAGWLADQQAG
jgi:preprotein translocase subunit SecE